MQNMNIWILPPSPPQLSSLLHQNTTRDGTGINMENNMQNNKMKL